MEQLELQKIDKKDQKGFQEYQWKLHFRLLSDLIRLQAFFLLSLITIALTVFFLQNSILFRYHYLWLSVSLLIIVGLMFYQRFTLGEVLEREKSFEDSLIMININGIVNAVMFGSIVMSGIFTYDLANQILHYNTNGYPEPALIFVIIAFLFTASLLTYRFFYYSLFYVLAFLPFLVAHKSLFDHTLEIWMMVWVDLFLVIMLVIGYIVSRNRQYVLWMRVQQSLHNSQISSYLNDVNKINLMLQQEMTERNNAQKRLSNWAHDLEVEVQTRTTDIRITSQKLAHSIQSFEMANQVAGIGSWDWQINKHEIHQSNVIDLLGYSNEELTSFLDQPEKIIHPEDLERFQFSLLEHLAGRSEKHDIQYRILHKQGYWVWVHDIGKVVERDNNTHQAIRMLGIRRDVDQEVKSAEQLKLAGNVYDHATIGIFIMNAKMEVLEVNPQFVQITGLQREQIINRVFNPELAVSANQNGDTDVSVIRYLLQNGEYDGEVMGVREGSPLPLWLTIRAVKKSTQEVTHFIGLLTDISHIKESEAKATYYANYDPLTELPNRAQLKQRLLQLIQTSEDEHKRFCVFEINIDRFKTINDSWGEHIGDSLLKEIAQRLLTFHPEAVITARLVSDHFVMVVQGATVHEHQQIIAFADKMIEIFKMPFDIDGKILEIDISVGIAIYPEHSKQVDGILNCAETALASVGTSNEKYAFASNKNPFDSILRLELEQDLRRAVAQQDIIVFFQPKVELKTGRISGFEALARWIHPVKGFISPGVFIPLAEEIGIIGQLGEVVLNKSCKQVREWIDIGLDHLQVSVNVVVQQIRRPSFIEKVDSILSYYGLETRHVELEITESSLMNRDEATQCFFDAVNVRGIDIALDDFGTGYSSLSYLAQYELNTLKIDKSFIDHAGTGKNEEAIVTAVLALGHSLGMKVVAEGIEIDPQLQFLIDNHCDMIQGYIVSKPLPSKEATDFLLRMPKNDEGHPCWLHPMISESMQQEYQLL